MQIFTVNITRVVWPHVTNLLDLSYFCQHNPLFYDLNLNKFYYWSWQRNIYFLVNIFVKHTFAMSKSSIKTKTVLTITDMTESTELLACKRPKDGYKVTVKISLCICVVLSWGIFMNTTKIGRWQTFHLLIFVLSREKYHYPGQVRNFRFSFRILFTSASRNFEWHCKKYEFFCSFSSHNSRKSRPATLD